MYRRCHYTSIKYNCPISTGMLAASGGSNPFGKAFADRAHRLFFAGMVKDLLSKGAPSGVCVILALNVNRLDRINHNFGLEAGDSTLSWVEQRAGDIAATQKEIDRFCLHRVRGSEFAMAALLQPRPDLQMRKLAAQLCERFIDEISATPFYYRGSTLPVRITAGARVLPQDFGGHLESEVLSGLSEASRAAQRLKHTGGGHSAVFDERADLHLDACEFTLSTVRQALKDNKVLVHYQPKVDLEDNSILGVEALVRMRGPLDASKLPGDFIPFIENTDLICSVGMRVIEIVLRDLVELAKRGIIIDASINVAARQLRDEEFASQVRIELAKHPMISPEQLTFEVVETGGISNISTAVETMDLLRAMGIKFELDDFGTGFSSFEYLKNLPVAGLKIDQSFVRKLLLSENDQAIVKSCIGLADNFGLTVIAEGVETEEIARKLRELGCNRVQGYLIARPMPLAVLIDWILRVYNTGSVRMSPALSFPSGALRLTEGA